MKSGMKIIRRWYATGPMLLVLVVSLVPGTFFAEPLRNDEGVEPEAAALSRTPAVIISEWPESPRKLAAAMIEKYGGPDLFGATALVWYDKGLWKRTTVFRDAVASSRETGSEYHLKQSLRHPVPDDKVAALLRFDGRITVDKELGLISVQTESEAMNHLALNIAEEIIAGSRTVDGARRFRRKTAALSQAGKSSPYLEGFLFPIKSVR